MILDLDYEEGITEDFTTDIDLHKRRLSDEQMHRYEGYAAEIFTAFGMDLQTPSTKGYVRPLHKGTVRGNQRLRRRSQAAQGVSH